MQCNQWRREETPERAREQNRKAAAVLVSSRERLNERTRRGGEGRAELRERAAEGAEVSLVFRWLVSRKRSRCKDRPQDILRSVN